jgi:regulator of protease activity HflC (stomatin/prohibitin superfamily)
MTNGSQDDPAARTAASIAAKIRRAEIALEAIKNALKEDSLEDLGAKAAAAASTLLGEAEALAAESETLARAKTELSGAVRRNPIGSLAVAFGAGLLLALLTRG